MSEQTVAERVGVLRQQMLALDEAIDLARNEARRLEASAKSRASLIRLERAVTAPAVTVAVPAATESSATKPPVVVPEDAPAFGHVESVAVAKPAPKPEPDVEQKPPASLQSASHLTVVKDTEEVSKPAVAKDEPAFGEPIRDPNKPQESSPLTVVDDEVEAAFDKFFSAEVEPEPAQQWLLSD